MRNTKDRLRHAIGFELIGLLISAPLVAWFFDLQTHLVGGLVVGLSIIATIWNYFYNKTADTLMAKYLGRLEKTWGERVWHAIFFEAGLLIFTLPIAAWWLGMSLLDALIIDMVMVVFYLVYAFVYNLAYDKIFPMVLAKPRIV